MCQLERLRGEGWKREREEGETYTTMRTVRATALLGRLVDLDVLDDQVAGVQALSVGVGFGVLEEREQECGGFLGPAGARDAELFACVRGFVSYSSSSPNLVHVKTAVFPAADSLEEIPHKTANNQLSFHLLLTRQTAPFMIPRY